MFEHDGPITHGSLAVEIFTGGPFMENCYLVYARQEPHAAWIVDAGHSAAGVVARTKELGLDVSALVNTHAHIDHVAAVAELKELLGVPFWLHGDEAPLLDAVPLQARMFGLPPCKAPTVDAPLEIGQNLDLGGHELTVLPTPGHTPGGCCLYFAAEGFVLVGDTLFAGSIGRTDLPGGDHEQLLTSIARELLTLPDEVIAYSGHGPPTTIGEERRHNPFLS